MTAIETVSLATSERYSRPLGQLQKEKLNMKEMQSKGKAKGRVVGSRFFCQKSPFAKQPKTAPFGLVAPPNGSSSIHSINMMCVVVHWSLVAAGQSSKLGLLFRMIKSNKPSHKWNRRERTLETRTLVQSDFPFAHVFRGEAKLQSHEYP